MKALPPSFFAAAAFVLLAWPAPGRCEVQVTVAYRPPAEATPAFQFLNVPAPAQGDAAAAATFSLLDGEWDKNGGGLAKLHDGALPSEEDDPAHSFFFQGTEGGRLLVDLGSPIDIGQVATYSWHPGARAPQVYRLYAADGKAAGFQSRPARPLDPETAGWKLLARVDTRESGKPPGGQYGVLVNQGAAGLGRYQYLLFDIVPTVERNVNANTFFSEINVLDRAASAPPSLARASVETFEIEGGKYRCYLDVTETPELADWAHRNLMPAVVEWYPRIVALLPSPGYTAPKRFSITLKRQMDGVAYTTGTAIFGASRWYAKNLQGEAVGSMVHELVHVVQQYRGKRPPGWIGEGIPDYIRFYLYEPQTRGAEIRPQDAAKAKYDGSYRTSANFLHWVTEKYDPQLVPKLNAESRAGHYDEALWNTWTGHSAEELAEEWKAALAAAGKRVE